MGIVETKSQIWDAITSNDAETLLSLLKKNKSLLNQPISSDNKTNAVTRASYLDRPHILAALYSLGADLDAPASTNITGLMWASARNKMSSVKFLIDFGADINKKGPYEMIATDFAVLFGSYDSAFYLCTKGARPTKTVEELKEIKDKMQTPWIDYAGLLMSLDKEIPPDVVPFFTVPPVYREPVFEDPVRDPNETWGSWVNRVLEFERPPLVERSSLQVRSEDNLRIKSEAEINNVTFDLTGEKNKVEVFDKD